MVGMTGGGKSSLCNLLAGTSFKVAKFVRGTINAAVDKGALDVPGFEYDEKFDSEALMNLVDVLRDHAENITAICLAMRYEEPRLTIHHKTIRMLKNFFGDYLKTNMCVIVTSYNGQPDYMIPGDDGRVSTINSFMASALGVTVPVFGVSCYPEKDTANNNIQEIPLFFAWLRGLQKFKSSSIPKNIELPSVFWKGVGEPNAADLAKYFAVTYFGDGSGGHFTRRYCISIPDNNPKWTVVKGNGSCYKREQWDDKNGRHFECFLANDSWEFELKPKY